MYIISLRQINIELQTTVDLKRFANGFGHLRFATPHIFLRNFHNLSILLYPLTESHEHINGKLANLEAFLRPVSMYIHS
jgi:hypothetical protein